MIALARRYRPRRFADLIVQDHVAAALRGAVAKNRVGHGYLLTGPRGVGKTTAARILAMALNCENRTPEGEPCGECNSCRKIWNGSADLDVVEIDAASNRGVDDARDLRERAMYAASQAGHHKVYIVDEAHMLTREAWNVLLKILEEPPPGVVFVFATTEPQKIANTAAPVMSRLQRFDFRRIGPAAIQQRLRQVLAAEKLDAEDDALLVIARHADGGMRDALSVLDQCLSFGEGVLTADRVRQALGLLGDEAFGELLGAVADRDPGRVFAIMDRVADSGADLAEFTGGLGELLRAVLMHHYGAEPEGLPESTRAVVTSLAPRLVPEDALRMLKLLGDAEPGIRRGSNPRIALETLLLRWTLMDRTVELRALLEGQQEGEIGERGERGEKAGKGGAAGSPGRTMGAADQKPKAPATTASAPQEAGAGLRASGAGLDLHPGLPFAWQEVIATASRQSPMLGQALGHATPRWEDPDLVVLAFGSGSAVFQEGVTRQASTVETILSAAAGKPVRTRVESAAAPAAAGGASPRRLTLEELRNERLNELRSKDPALDAAATTLDLELVDEE
ncbi:MAG: DNA polymerase III subunit gamma/tau [Gemmatimonadales bacterium]